MKKLFFASIFLFAVTVAFTQTKPKQTSKEKPPTQTELDKMMEDSMEGMSDDEKAEMKEMMKGVMPSLNEQNLKVANYPEFTSNKQLVPKKDMVKINAIPKEKLTQADMGPYAANLYNKIMTKGDAAEIALVKKVIAKSPSANDLGSAAVLCMMQGQSMAAMALCMKAVQADPINANWQNNMASLLTQYGYPEQAIPVLEKLRFLLPEPLFEPSIITKLPNTLKSASLSTMPTTDAVMPVAGFIVNVLVEFALVFLLIMIGKVSPEL